MKTKNVFLEQMSSCYTQKNWFVGLVPALEGLTAKQASWKNSDSNHSIKELVTHILFWCDRYLKEFQGIQLEKLNVDNEFTFTEKSLNSISWEETIIKIKLIAEDWMISITAADEEKINEADFKWGSIISNLILHTTYHVGQIVCLRKVQGSWSDDLGVK